LNWDDKISPTEFLWKKECVFSAKIVVLRMKTFYASLCIEPKRKEENA
jgi:hypothetical protein